MNPPKLRSALPRERREHGRLDRERHLRLNLIDNQTTPRAHPACMSLNHEYPESTRIIRTKKTCPLLPIREKLSNSWLKIRHARTMAELPGAYRDAVATARARLGQVAM
jgi:hypothetical protein